MKSGVKILEFRVSLWKLWMHVKHACPSLDKFITDSAERRVNHTRIATCFCGLEDPVVCLL